MIALILSSAAPFAKGASAFCGAAPGGIADQLDAVPGRAQQESGRRIPAAVATRKGGLWPAVEAAELHVFVDENMVRSRLQGGSAKGPTVRGFAAKTWRGARRQPRKNQTADGTPSAIHARRQAEPFGAGRAAGAPPATGAACIVCPCAAGEERCNPRAARPAHDRKAARQMCPAPWGREISPDPRQAAQDRPHSLLRRRQRPRPGQHCTAKPAFGARRGHALPGGAVEDAAGLGVRLFHRANGIGTRSHGARRWIFQDGTGGVLIPGGPFGRAVRDGRRRPGSSPAGASSVPPRSVSGSGSPSDYRDRLFLDYHDSLRLSSFFSCLTKFGL